MITYNDLSIAIKVTLDSTNYLIEKILEGKTPRLDIITMLSTIKGVVVLIEGFMHFAEENDPEGIKSSLKSIKDSIRTIDKKLGIQPEK